VRLEIWFCGFIWLTSTIAKRTFGTK